MFTKHGLRKHSLYSVWCNMKTRCYNKNRKEYKNYGARGITVCEEWEKNFLKFYQWAVSNNWTKDLSIDRINNDKGYSPQILTVELLVKLE